MIKALVASQNPVKQAAAKEALEKFCGEPVMVDLYHEEVLSGVSEQPLSLKETTTGALNRLKAISSQPGYDYYIAIEGGTYEVNIENEENWYESACATVTDKTQATKPSIAYGPAYPIPAQFIRHLKDGKDLNEAMVHETGITNAGKADGFDGWITKGHLDRKSSSYLAVLLALHGLEHQ